MTTPRPDLNAPKVGSAEWRFLKQESVKWLIQNHPDLWQKCYPRIYDEAAHGQYDSVKLLGIDMLGAVLKIEDGFMGENEKQEIVWASRMAARRVPVYWLTPDMAEAIKKTTPPRTLQLTEMALPFEAAAFMLPRGTLVHEDKDEGEASFISYVRTKYGESVKSLARSGPPDWHMVGHGVMTVFAHTTGDHLIHWTMPDNELIDLAKLDELVQLFEQYPQHHSETPRMGKWMFLGNPNLTHADNAFMSRVAHLLLGTVLLMTSRPDLVTTGSLRRRVEKPQQPPKEFWSPNIIGEHYKIRKLYEPQGGTHASPRGHWVRGFYREQAHGPQHSLRKEIWVEPFWRGGDAE